MTIRNNTPKFVFPFVLQGQYFINRRLRFATPTVNNMLPLRGLKGMIADSHHILYYFCKKK
jgi:hypothetical protein